MTIELIGELAEQSGGGGGGGWDDDGGCGENDYMDCIIWIVFGIGNPAVCDCVEGG